MSYGPNLTTEARPPYPDNAPKELILEHYDKAIAAILARWEDIPLAEDLKHIASELRDIATGIMAKRNEIKALNREVLFDSRKAFGMFGNIQYAVEDIRDNRLIVRICSQRTDWGGTREDGGRIPTRDEIMQNVRKSMEDRLGDRYEGIDLFWDDWKEGDGYGFVI